MMRRVTQAKNTKHIVLNGTFNKSSCLESSSDGQQFTSVPAVGDFDERRACVRATGERVTSIHDAEPLRVNVAQAPWQASCWCQFRGRLAIPHHIQRSGLTSFHARGTGVVNRGMMGFLT
jgi:hypothetical protein